MNSNRAILLTVGLLLLTVAVFEATSLDLQLQDRLYDSASGKWIVDRDAPLPKAVFYDGPKFGVGLLGAFLILCALVPASRSARFPFSRREAAFLLCCVGLVPFTVGTLKKTTGVYGPWRLARYSGEHEYRKVLESIPYVAGRPRGHEFPAGHCSGGFALTGLYFVAKFRSRRWLGIVCGLAAGWSVGIYQMLKGVHFLSHTIVTMIRKWSG